MNKVVLMGRITKDLDKKEKVTNFTVAVDRKFKREGDPSADFIDCVAFGKTKEIVDKYFEKGQKIAVDGRIQTGSYEKDGRKIYTTDVVAESVEFCESKKKEEAKGEPAEDENGFVTAPADEGLPFK